MPRASFSTSVEREDSCLKFTKVVQWFLWDTQEQHGTHCHSGKCGRENQVSQWGVRVWRLLLGQVWVGRLGGREPCGTEDQRQQKWESWIPRAVAGGSAQKEASCRNGVPQRQPSRSPPEHSEEHRQFLTSARSRGGK